MNEIELHNIKAKARKEVLDRRLERARKISLYTQSVGLLVISYLCWRICYVL